MVKHTQTSIQDSTIYELQDNINLADIVMIDTHRSTIESIRSARNQSYRQGSKVIGVDYSDPIEPKGFIKGLHSFFKRSNVIRQQGKSQHILNRAGISPIHYCGRVDFKHLLKGRELFERDVDFACFFNPSSKTKRTRLAEFLKHLNNNSSFQKYSFHVGVIGEQGRLGRNNAQEEYIRLLLRTKICVTAYPDSYEGDWRFWEALICGCFVLCDDFVQVPQHLVKGIDYDTYSSEIDLKNKLIKYSQNLELFKSEVIKIRISNILVNHMPSNRVEEMLRSVYLGGETLGL